MQIVSPVAPTARRGRRWRLLPLAVLLLVMALTACLVAWVASVQRAEDTALLERRVEAFGIALSGRVQAYVDTLPGLSEFGAIRRAATDQEFSQYVQAISLERRFPGLALTFVADRVRATESSRYVDAVRGDRSLSPTGHPEFAIRPPGDRAEYMPIRHVHPLDGETFGYDLYDPAQSYRAAVDRAIESGRNTATGPILLARDRFAEARPELTNVVVRMPLYDTPVTPASPALRRQTARGVVGISFRTGDLVRSTLPAELGSGVHIVIADIQARADKQRFLVYDSAWADGNPPGPGVAEPIRFKVDVADRVWEIAVVREAAAQAPWMDTNRWLILALGSLLAAACAVVTRALVDANWQAEIRVQQATQQLVGERDNLERSERRYRLLFETSQEAMLRTRPSGGILAANDAAVRLFGWSEAEMIGRGREGVVDRSDPRLPAFLETRTRTGHAHGLMRMMKADASVFEAEFTSSVYLDTDGQPCTSLMVRDVTERQRAAQSQAMLTAILDSTPDFVGSADADTRNIFMNRAWRRLLGFGESDDVSSVGIGDCHPPWARDLVLREGMPAALLRGVWSGQTALLAHDGSELPVSQVIICHRDPRGQLTHFSTIARDLSPVRQAENERRALEVQLRESQKMESIGTLAGGVAHDFNNVLAAILGNAAMAIEALEQAHPAQQNLDRIKRAASRARSLVQQILTFSRKTPQQLTVQALGPLVEEAVSLLRSTLPPTVVLKAAIASEPLCVLADGAQVQQVVVNLCTNAWQALPDERGVVEVSLQSVQIDAANLPAPGLEPGRYALLSVSDDGIGMDAATRARVFEPFFTTKRVGEGTGLGLAVVHGIVASSSGAITIESRPGAGSRFSIYLPCHGMPAPEASTELHELHEPQRAAGGGEHILYVDDDEVVSLTMKALLERSGYQVTLHANGTDALAELAAHPSRFSLVISDFNMPDISGLRVAEQMRERHPQLPVIIASGYVTEELTERAAALGVKAVLMKQYSLERLVPLVFGVLNAR